MRPEYADEARASRERPAVAVFGGGTGLHTLLKGLKKLTDDLTAIVAVTDDGGSSGRLRSDYRMLPPGDIRNCLVALARDESLITELFQHRFKGSDLGGHSFGNLFIAALTQITGDFGKAIKLAGSILAIRGRVLPATLDHVSLEAEHDDGTKTIGERRISQACKPIRRVALRPRPGKVPQDVKDAIARADKHVFGPGSLFTSVLPPLLNEGMVDEIAASGADGIYVCNVMTQPGETEGFSAADHVEAIFEHTGRHLFDTVLVNTGPIPPKLLERYAQEGAEPVLVDRVRIEALGLRVIGLDVISNEDYVRHNPEKLAAAIL